MASKQLREMKKSEKRWWLRTRPIYSITVYKDSIYSGSDSVQDLNSKRNGSRLSMLGRRKLLTLSAVVDFLYFNIWLRKNQRKVGRLSAGSRITSLLTANDVVLCGTQTG